MASRVIKGKKTKTQKNKGMKPSSNMTNKKGGGYSGKGKKC